MNSLKYISPQRFISYRYLHSRARERKTRELLDTILRVDHAGEAAAVRIYKGQLKVLGKSKSAACIQVIISVNKSTN